MWDVRGYPCWGSLADGLRTGKPQNEIKGGEDLFSALYLNPERLRLFLRSMTGHSLPSAMAIAQKFPWQKYKTFADVGTAEIRARRPDWELFRDGCSGGESPDEVGARADRVVDRVRAVKADVLIFSSGHFLRVLTSRWLGLGPQAGRYFLLSTASLSALSCEHDLSQPVIQLWNDLHHLMHH